MNQFQISTGPLPLSVISVAVQPWSVHIQFHMNGLGNINWYSVWRKKLSDVKDIFNNCEGSMNWRLFNSEHLMSEMNVMLIVCFNLELFLVLPPEHQNYFGVDDNLGPVAVSIRRERLDDGKEKDGMQYNYRVTFRTSQVTTIHCCALCL